MGTLEAEVCEEKILTTHKLNAGDEPKPKLQPKSQVRSHIQAQSEAAQSNSSRPL